jgi:hypothetical protein
MALLLVACSASGKVGPVSGAMPGRGSRASANRRAAQVGARRLLNEVVLPANSIRSTTEPSGGSSLLSRAGAGPVVTPVVIDRHAWWRIPGSMASVSSFIRAHSPAGTIHTMEGWSSIHGRTLERWLGYLWPATPSVLSERYLVIEVAPLTRGFVGVRADAEVAWFVPRSARERVPSGARVLGVTRAFPGRAASLSLRFTNRAQVQRVATMLDRLPIVQPGLINCPAVLVLPVVTLTFKATQAGRPLAQASMPSDGPHGECPGITFTVRGHRQTPLFAGPSVIQQIDQTLGITLNRR